ncbi:expressed unknown protein [Seminavis robusta]|uniref:Uncharacterized protein n=1 Tax=Seminavis robusta TaxID=568900 RepID=A0A9N8HF20_9STRA|nr:expressed unknown protein [Seminavis robusta]|eukprot:Sro545_g163830.1 n/a (822) ;mRNA; r:15806-18271
MKVSAEDLSYETMTVEACGKVMSTETKRELRERNGYCLSCKGPPTLCFIVTKSRINPLWTNKEPRTEEGGCFEGHCLKCKPEKGPRWHQQSGRMLLNSSSHHASRRDIQRGLSSGSLALSQSRRDLFRASQNRCGGRDVTRQASNSSLTTASTHSGSSRCTYGSTFPSSRSLLSPTNSGSSRSRAPVDLVRASNSNNFSSYHHHDDTFGLDDSVHNGENVPPVAPSPAGVFGTRHRGTQGHFTRPPSQISLSSTEHSSSSYLEPSTCNERGINGSTTCNSSTVLQRSSSSGSTPNHGSAAAPAPAPPPLTESLSPKTIRRVANLTAFRSNPGLAPTITSSDINNSHNSHNNHYSQPQPENEDRTVDETEENLKTLLEELAHAKDFEFLVEVLVNALQSSSDKENIKVICLQTICKICKTDSGNKERLVRVNAHEECVIALKNFGNCSQVQQIAAAAIACLASVNQETRTTMVLQGVCQMLVGLLQQFLEEESVVAAGLSALRGLSTEASTRESFRLVVASKYVCETMEKYLDNVPVQRDGIAFLSNTSIDMEGQKVSIVSRGVLKAIFEALSLHKTDGALVRVGTFALRNLTYERQNLRTLRGIHGIFELFVECEDSRILEYPDSYEVLEQLHMSQAQDESLEYEALESLHVLVAIKGDRPAAILEIGNLLRNHEWSAKVTSECLYTLALLGAESRENRTAIKTLGLKVVVDLMKQHFMDDAFMANASSLLEVMAQDDAHVRQELLSDGACSLILEYLEKSLGNETASPGKALSALMVILATATSWDDQQKGLAIVMQTMHQHEQCEVVQLCGQAILAKFG